MIRVENLSFTYPKNTIPTVKGIDFVIGQGEIFGFLGPSGAGKSTTQKILTKLLSGFSGEAIVLGKSVREWDNQFYNHIGLSFELPNHYLKLTALENLRFFAAFYQNPTSDFLGLLDKVGLAEDANKKVKDFSKGMKMRLNFIRALLHNPEILFLDEPTSGLDPGNARKIKDLILELKEQGKTIFVTTHRMEDADELCDRIGFIVEGSIVLVGEPEQLKLEYGRRKVNVEYFNGVVKKEAFDLDNLGQNEAFLKILQQSKIRTIHTEEATLESIFIQVTGKKLVA